MSKLSRSISSWTNRLRNTFLTGNQAPKCQSTILAGIGTLAFLFIYYFMIHVSISV